MDFTVRMSGGCQADVRRMPGGCWADAGRMLGGCWADAGRMLGGCWADAGRMRAGWVEQLIDSALRGFLPTCDLPSVFQLHIGYVLPPAPLLPSPQETGFCKLCPRKECIFWLIIRTKKVFKNVFLAQISLGI